MRRFALIGIALAVGCGSSTPTSPQPPTPSTVTISGRITTTISGEPIAGATLTIAGRTITTDSAGNWTLPDQTQNASLPASIAAPGYLTRDTTIGTQQGRTGLALDLIRNGGLFSLNVYRELVRNGYEHPAALQAVTRWTRNPNFYIHAINPQTGQPLDTAHLTRLEAIIRETVPAVTGNTLSAGTIESGSTARPLSAGTINIGFVYQPTANRCGESYVGRDPGEVTYFWGNCRCDVYQVYPEIVAHELGHALGLYHASAGVMKPSSGTGDCLNTTFTEPERYHARIAYARQNGNLDIDRDSSSTTLQTIGLARKVVCPR